MNSSLQSSTHRRPYAFYKAVACIAYAKRRSVPAHTVVPELFPGEVDAVVRDVNALVLRAGEIPSHGGTSEDYGAELSAATAAVQAASYAVRESALGRIGAVQIELRQNASSVTPLSAQVVEAGKAIPLSVSSAMLLDMVPVGVKALAVASAEFFRFRGNDRVLVDLGTRAVADAVDAAFFDPSKTTSLTNGLSAVTVADSTPNGIAWSIYQAATTMANADFRNVSLLAHPLDVIALSLLADNVSGAAFGGDLRRAGLAGLNVAPTRGLPQGTLVLVDGAQTFVGFDPSLIVEASTSGSVEMSSAPTEDSGARPPVASQVVSLFSTDSVAIRFVLPCAAKMARTGCIALLTGFDADSSLIS
jgi:hypothetical protein